MLRHYKQLFHPLEDFQRNDLNVKKKKQKQINVVDWIDRSLWLMTTCRQSASLNLNQIQDSFK